MDEQNQNDGNGYANVDNNHVINVDGFNNFVVVQQIYINSAQVLFTAFF